MSLLEGSCREVLELAEVVTMVTMGPDGPHMTATWGDYVRTMGVGENRLVVPAGFYRVMEANLETNPGVQVLVASRGGRRGGWAWGRLFTLKGTARIETAGADFDRVKAAFPWARGALIVDVAEAKSHL